MKILILFTNFGPYHIARLRGAHENLPQHEIIGLELAAEEKTYPWKSDRSSLTARLDTLHPGVLEEIPVADLQQKLLQYLNREQPDVIAIAGYARSDMRAALKWAKKHGKIAILMSESKSSDAQRRGWKEWLKSRMVRQFDAALVGGREAKSYAIELGLPEKRVCLGYNAVGNDDFFTQAEKWRREAKSPLERPYFLTANRFVPRKNLLNVIRAYEMYRQAVEVQQGKHLTWDLVLIGAGEHEDELRTAAQNIQGIHFTGFLQQDEISRYMAFAGCFVHASLQEQWGLVVNEAMACGLPVLVSETCGCAPDLVEKERNGFTFDPLNVPELAKFMQKIAQNAVHRDEMGRASLEIIAQWGPQRFAQGLGEAVEAAHKARSRAI